jgi:cell wall-associated NlpC family hydrolase
MRHAVLRPVKATGPLSIGSPSWRAAVCLTAALCSFGAVAQESTSGASHDPVAALLAERGLLAKPSSAENATAASAPTSFLQAMREKTSDMVVAAMNFLGVPYRMGGNTASEGFDCSGFTRHIFEMSLGLVLPRRADDQARASGLFEIARSELKPGDLVFFNTLRTTFSHVGIYIGDGKFIHSPRAGSAVRIENMRMSYWDQRFTGARRVDAEIVRAAAQEAARP